MFSLSLHPAMRAALLHRVISINCNCKGKHPQNLNADFPCAHSRSSLFQVQALTDKKRCLTQPSKRAGLLYNMDATETRAKQGKSPVWHMGAEPNPCPHNLVSSKSADNSASPHLSPSRLHIVGADRKLQVLQLRHVVHQSCCTPPCLLRARA